MKDAVELIQCAKLLPLLLAEPTGCTRGFHLLGGVLGTILSKERQEWSWVGLGGVPAPLS